MDAGQKLTFFEKIKSKFNFGGHGPHKPNGSIDHISKGSRSQDCRNSNEIKMFDRRNQVKDLEYKPRKTSEIPLKHQALQEQNVSTNYDNRPTLRSSQICDQESAPESRNFHGHTGRQMKALGVQMEDEFAVHQSNQLDRDSPVKNFGF